MKIAYTVPIKFPSRGADTIHIMKMCSAFARQGHALTLIIPEYSEQESGIENIYEYYGAEENFSIIYAAIKLPKVTTKHLRRVFKLARLAAGGGFDGIYSRNLRLCFILTCIYRHDAVFEYHEAIWPDTKNGKMFRHIINSGYVRKMVVITEALKQFYISQYNLDEKFIYVAPDGADIPPETTGPAELVPSSTGMFRAGYIGHLYKGRGIEMLGEIASACPFAFFHIIGGLDADVKYWKEQYKDIKNIHFYGFVPPAQTVSYGRAMDVLIAPYQYVVATNVNTKDEDSTAKWMSPMKIFEYMALGKPIIASDLPVLKEVLTDAENGLLCTPDDPFAWIKAIKRLYEDAELSGKLAENAFISAGQHTWDARAKNLTEHVLTDTQNPSRNTKMSIIKFLKWLPFLIYHEVSK